MYWTQEEILQETEWSRSTFFRRRRDSFPAPVNEGEKPLRWRIYEVEAWLDENASEPNADERLLMDRFPDWYEEGRDAIDDQRDDIEEGLGYQEAYDELEQKARDAEFEEAMNAWIGVAVAAEDSRDEGTSLEDHARELFDRKMHSGKVDTHALVKKHCGEELAELNGARDLRIRRCAHLAGIAHVKAMLRDERAERKATEKSAPE